MDGRTALHHAVLDPSIGLDIVQLLIDLGADVNIKDYSASCESALHVAMRQRDLEVVQLVLESPTFNMTLSDSRYPASMVPDCCLVERIQKIDVNGHSSTLSSPRRRRHSTCRQSTVSMSDAYALIVRRDSTASVAADSSFAAEHINHLIVLRDLSTSLHLDRLLRRLDHRTLTTLYLVDCRLDQSAVDDALSGLRLRTVVLSGTELRRVPDGLFRSSASTLGVLKIDRNKLSEIPPEVGRLSSLRTLCCDAQRPGLRCLPVDALSRLSGCLEVLSFSDNRVVDVSWVPDALPQLQVLLCARNRISRLPDELCRLERLTTLDVAHNELRSIQTSLFPLVSRLCRFEFFNATLRPTLLRRMNLSGLVSHLELEYRLSNVFQEVEEHHSTSKVRDADRTNGPVSSAVLRAVDERDVTIAFVGEASVGKRTLIDALNPDSSTSTTGGGSSRRQSTLSQQGCQPVFTSSQFSVAQSSGNYCLVNSLVVSAADILDEFVRQVSVDLFVLTFDLTTFEPLSPSSLNGAKQQQQQQQQQVGVGGPGNRRPIARLQMWLQALYELDPDCRVVLVGTHADRVPAARLPGTWRRLMDGLLDPARHHHATRTAATTAALRRPRTCPHCLLCRPKYLAVRHAPDTPPPPVPATPPVASTNSPFNSDSAETSSVSAKSSSQPASSRSDVSSINQSTGFVDLSFPVGNGSAVSASTNGHVTSGSDSASARLLRFPHIVGYYETGVPSTLSSRRLNATTTNDVDWRRKKATSSVTSSASVDRLLAAVLRLSSTSTQLTEDGCERAAAAPSGWIQLCRHISSPTGTAATVQLPFVGFDELVLVAKQFGLKDDEEVSLALRYLHRRGRVVYVDAAGCNSNDVDRRRRHHMTSRLVCISPSWFVQTVQRVMTSLDRSAVSVSELFRCVEREIRQQCSGTTQASSSTYKQNPVSASNSSSGSGPSTALSIAVQQWLISAILRLGVGFCPPSRPPSFTAGSGSSSSVVIFPALLETGSPTSDVWPEIPDFTEKQVTCEFRVRSMRPGFFTDVIKRLFSGCREMRRLRVTSLPVASSCTAEHVVFSCCSDLTGCDDCRSWTRLSRFSSSPSVSGQTPVSRVHLALVADMDVVRVQVRAVDGACCVARAVLDLLDVYLDDVPDERLQQQNCSAVVKPGAVDDSLPLYGDQLVDDVDADAEDKSDRQFFLLCPKCILLRVDFPERVRLHRRKLTSRPARRAVCPRWHQLGSWSRAAVGDYRAFTFGLGAFSSSNTRQCRPSNNSSSTPTPAAASSSTPLVHPHPDYDHPRLVVLLPGGVSAAVRDWYLFSRASFLEDVDVHLLCENPSSWHFVDGSVFRLRLQASGPSSSLLLAQQQQQRSRCRQLPLCLTSLAATVLRVFNCVQSARLVAQVVSELGRSCAHLLPPVDTADSSSSFDPKDGLSSRNRDRVLTMLTSVLTNVGGPPTADDSNPRGIPVDASAELSIAESMIFQSPVKGSRRELARLLRAQDADGRFGALRSVAIGHEIRWVCERHFEELRRCCVTTSARK